MSEIPEIPGPGGTVEQLLAVISDLVTEIARLSQVVEGPGLLTWRGFL